MSTLQQFNVVERKFAEADLLCIPKPTKYDGKGNANYRARVEIGRNRQTDVPVYKSIYGKTDAEARQKAYDFIQRHQFRDPPHGDQPKLYHHPHP